MCGQESALWGTVGGGWEVGSADTLLQSWRRKVARPEAAAGAKGAIASLHMAPELHGLGHLRAEWCPYHPARETGRRRGVWAGRGAAHSLLGHL